MTIKLNEENDGKLIVIHVTGKLIKDDYAEFEVQVPVLNATSASSR